MRRAAALVAAFAVIPVGVAVANSDMKVTGGGQVLADGQASGPGDTIAFNAQQISADGSAGFFLAKGQLQVIDRDDSGGGARAVKFHGAVACIRDFTDDNDTPSDTSDDEVYVRFGGYQKVRGKVTSTPFTVDVQDNGEGANALGADMIFFRTRDPGANPCDDSDTATSLRSSTLARGNVQQH
jgi:hypothetical protein